MTAENNKPSAADRLESLICGFPARNLRRRLLYDPQLQFALGAGPLLGDPPMDLGRPHTARHVIPAALQSSRCAPVMFLLARLAGIATLGGIGAPDAVASGRSGRTKAAEADPAGRAPEREIRSLPSAVCVCVCARGQCVALTHSAGETSVLDCHGVGDESPHARLACALLHLRMRSRRGGQR